MKTLSENDINRFIDLGFVKIENAFPKALADECRSILWEATGFSSSDPTTWTKPVVRIADMALKPFRDAANSTSLHAAFDQLVGPGRWLPRESLGSFPIRFPSNLPAEDTGWHVDASFSVESTSNYLEWRININSKGRALLMLFLFSDVGIDDAPTIVKSGSHKYVAQILEPAGGEGLSFMELAKRFGDLSEFRNEYATGAAGTVYLCHPFLIHAAQDHRGKNPKFMAQPALIPAVEFNLHEQSAGIYPVEEAIQLAITKKYADR